MSRANAWICSPLNNPRRLRSNHHYHLGTQPIRRSTLTDANETRPVGLYKELFYDCLFFVAIDQEKLPCGYLILAGYWPTDIDQRVNRDSF
jgi:hypothetical protein